MSAEHIPLNLRILAIDQPLTGEGYAIPCDECFRVVERAMFLALGPKGERTAMSEFIRTQIYETLLGEGHDAGRGAHDLSATGLLRVAKTAERRKA